MSINLFQRYDIKSRLGEGAQSKVFLVEDTQNEKVLKAAKVLKREYLKAHSDEGLIQEFQLLESVDHENLVQVYECRFLPKDKAPVIISEYVRGAKDLEVYLTGDLSLTYKEKLQIFYQILSALRYLHGKKIIHGDLKPSNILIGKDKSIPTVKLIDFGVSYDLLSKEKKKRVGTPYYIAPEAVSEGVQRASDLYSLGVILYRLFINKDLPYKGKGIQEILSDHLQGSPLFNEEDFSNTDLPQSLLNFLRSCLHSDPLERPRNLGETLRKFRFEFEEALGTLPSSASDIRLRQTLGMKSSLYIAQNFIMKNRTHFPKDNSSKRILLFVSAPSGGGKSRFLSEVSRFCQKEKINTKTFSFKPFDFWSQTVEILLHQYPQAKTVKRMRGRLLQSLKTQEDLEKKHLFARFLHNLAHDLDGLVLLIDGLTQQLPTGFLDTLKTIATSSKRKKVSFSKLALVLTVHNRALANEIKSDSDRLKLTQLMNDLNSSFLDSRKTPENQDQDEQALKQWSQIPDEVRSLGIEGMTHLLSLSPWKKEEIKQYLSEVFPEINFSHNFFEKVLEKTNGNPGILQALCSEALKNMTPGQNLPPRIIESLLLELSRDAKVHDLHVYKLKYYDDRGRALLALLSASESSPKTLMEEIWNRLFVHEGKDEIQKILIRAFDDGLIQIDRDLRRDLANYIVNNQNLRNKLQEEAREFSKPVGFLLRKILQQGESFLNTRHHLFLARFLGVKKAWAKALLSLLDQEKSTTKKLALEPDLTQLREDLSHHFDFNEVDWDTRLQLDFNASELYNLQYKFEEAEKLSEGILESINDRNDPFANGLRAKTQLVFGTVLRIRFKLKQAISCLKEAVDSELLSDRDHYYALGSMAQCQLRSMSKDEDKKEVLEYLHQARKELRKIDPVRYAILTVSFGGYYLDNKEYLKAIPYLETAARIYGEQGETSRQIISLRRIGKVYYLLGRYNEALELFNRTLPMAERMGLDEESKEILIYTIRTCYMIGDFRKFAPACLHLTSICERLGDITPLANIIEPATHAFLQNGQTRKALELVNAQLKALQNPSKPTEFRDATICELLLLRIYQCLGKWEAAQKQNVRAKEKVNNLTGQHAHAESARQVHDIYYLELLRHEQGAKSALEKIESLFEQKAFKGFLLQEAYFLAFRYAVWAEEIEKAEKYIPRCLQIISKIPASERMDFYTNLGKFYLDQNELLKSEKALKKASSLLNMVTHHIFRAQLFDQLARLSSRQGKREQALRKWNLADQEFQLNSRTWESQDREVFKETSYEWQEHRVIFMLLQTGVQ